MMSIMKPKPPFYACTWAKSAHQVRDADNAVLYSGRGDQPDTYYISYMVLDWYRNKYPGPKTWEVENTLLVRSDGFRVAMAVMNTPHYDGRKFRTNLAELLNTHPFGQEDYS